MRQSKNQNIVKTNKKAISKLSDSEWGSTVSILTLGQRLVIEAKSVTLRIGASQMGVTVGRE